MKTWLAFWYGIFKNNPTFRLVLGLCPTLAVTTSLENALGMGLAAGSAFSPQAARLITMQSARSNARNFFILFSS